MTAIDKVRPTHQHCQICGKSFRQSDLVAAELVRDAVGELIRRDHPDFAPEGWICLRDLSRYRGMYVRTVLERDMGELGSLEEEVVRGLREQELVTANLNEEFARSVGLGDRVADRMAEVGGSWAFVLGFLGVLAVWILVNTVVLLRRPFDPFPFILLNLVLSCVAAIQAPVIMMSQNRQEAKDRMRAEHDYRVNLKAELEVRLLSERVDRLLSHQWRRLLEIQEIQVELIEDLKQGRGRDRTG